MEANVSDASAVDAPRNRHSRHSAQFCAGDPARRRKCLSRSRLIVSCDEKIIEQIESHVASEWDAARNNLEDGRFSLPVYVIVIRC
jgi:hypothetical protein